VAAEPVGNPRAWLARVIEIQHGGDRVDAQTIDVIAIEPEKRIADQKIDDFLPSEIVDRGVPIGMKSLSRIGMLVERRAVEMREPVRIDREMRGHPIEQHANARAMTAIDESRKAGGLAEAPGRREETDRLIAP